MTEFKTLLSCILLLVSVHIFAQTESPDLKSGYRFDYANCYPPKKKKEATVCVHYRNEYYIDGKVNLVVNSETKYASPGRDVSYHSTVPIKKLSLDHNIVKSTETYTDSMLVVHEIWTLKMETDSHYQEVITESISDILGRSTDNSYLISLDFHSEKDAETAWNQIHELRMMY